MTPEEYERWMIRDCARCGRRASKSAEWSDGPICRTCYDRAMRVRGRFLCCDTDRLLPGRDTDGAPICRDCAGIVRDFFCDRCGFEGLLLGGRLCEHCTLADTLARLLDDGTGRVAPELLPSVKILLEMDRPKSRLIRLRNPNVVRLLQGLATGSIPLAHDGLHQETPWRTVTHRRDLLMNSTVLPRVDRQLLLYQRWLTERLATIEEPEHRQLLRHFATWHQMRRLRAKAEKGPLGRSQSKPHQAGSHPGRRLPRVARRPRTGDRAVSAGRHRRLAHRVRGNPPSDPVVSAVVHEERPDAPPHAAARGHHSGFGTAAPAPPARDPPPGPQRRLLAPAGPGSPPPSFSSTGSPSAASSASPPTTSSTTRPSPPSGWETRRPRCRSPSPT
ncbi:hypothetical protein ACFWWM_36465 [Streptomyces sp. NPDC058682]|uniref:hypothetical protein n=1 Tax=Streptomyces sp. NPDC058682 TaxID=3346596 RepID=UPI00365C9886